MDKELKAHIEQAVTKLGSMDLEEQMLALTSACIIFERALGEDRTKLTEDQQLAVTMLCQFAHIVIDSNAERTLVQLRKLQGDPFFFGKRTPEHN